MPMAYPFRYVAFAFATARELSYLLTSNLRPPLVPQASAENKFDVTFAHSNSVAEADRAVPPSSVHPPDADFPECDLNGWQCVWLTRLDARRTVAAKRRVACPRARLSRPAPGKEP